VLKRLLTVLLLLACVLTGGGDRPFTYTPEMEAALARISPGKLRGDLSFLASDALEGRGTPSRGQDVAAEFIAAQFRAAGLAPVAGSYFQSAPFVERQPGPVTLELEDGSRVPPDEIAVRAAAALNLERISVVKVAEGERPDVAGKVALIEGSFSLRRLRELREWKPALIIYHDEHGDMVREMRAASPLSDPETDAPGAPLLVVHDDRLTDAATLTVHIPAPRERPVALRNVAGLLRGSDPRLRDTYILVTAHYDHLGRKAGCTEGDCIYNGANDDGSGTVSVIALARALAALPVAPRRSILFMTFSGEEEGTLGSRYYARHPLVPLSATVAGVNLEQLGRTDSESGLQIGTATFTGFDFSDLPTTFQAAGKLTGVNVYNTATSADYFSRSDNQMLADAGIPAHTVCVAYSYPDYHGLEDTWEKIDYENMARVNRMLALGVLMLAHNSTPPRWNAADPQTRTYLDAWKRARAE